MPIRGVDQPPTDLTSLAGQLKVLAEPKRLRILHMLMEGVQCNCELGDALDMAPNLISHLSWPKNPSVQEYAGSSSVTHCEYRPESDILTTDSAHGCHSPLTKDNTLGTIMATAPLHER